MLGLAGNLIGPFRAQAKIGCTAPNGPKCPTGTECEERGVRTCDGMALAQALIADQPRLSHREVLLASLIGPLLLNTLTYINNTTFAKTNLRTRWGLGPGWCRDWAGLGIGLGLDK